MTELIVVRTETVFKSYNSWAKGLVSVTYIGCNHKRLRTNYGVSIPISRLIFDLD